MICSRRLPNPSARNRKEQDDDDGDEEGVVVVAVVLVVPVFEAAWSSFSVIFPIVILNNTNQQWNKLFKVAMMIM